MISAMFPAERTPGRFPQIGLAPMNILSRDKQIKVIAALSEGMSIRSVERLTGIHRDTIMRLGARVGPSVATHESDSRSLLSRFLAREIPPVSKGH
jgi:hypothetical protein